MVKGVRMLVAALAAANYYEASGMLLKQEKFEQEQAFRMKKEMIERQKLAKQKRKRLANQKKDPCSGPNCDGDTGGPTAPAPKKKKKATKQEGIEEENMTLVGSATAHLSATAASAYHYIMGELANRKLVVVLFVALIAGASFLVAGYFKKGPLKHFVATHFGTSKNTFLETSQGTASFLETQGNALHGFDKGFSLESNNSIFDVV